MFPLLPYDSGALVQILFSDAFGVVGKVLDMPFGRHSFRGIEIHRKLAGVSPTQTAANRGHLDDRSLSTRSRPRSPQDERERPGA